VGVAREALEEALEVLVQHRVLADLVLEGLELALAGERPVDEQVGGLQEGGLLGELLDGVAAVAQDPRVTVDVGDRAGAAGGVDEATVEGDIAGLLEQSRDVVAVVALGGRDEFEVELLALGGEEGPSVVGHPSRPSQVSGCGRAPQGWATSPFHPDPTVASGSRVNRSAR